MVFCIIPFLTPLNNGISNFLKSELFLLRFILSFSKFCTTASFFLTCGFFLPVFSADPTIVFHWSSVTSENDPDLLKARDSTLLSAGPGGNGNGHIVTLGYFDEANSSSLENHFLGSWVPLTEGTRVGDSSTGYGFSDGMFSFTTVFQRASNQVIVFPYQPATYQVQAPFSITSSAPSPGTPVCIRFYDGTEIGPAARYNTVTGPNWLWPSFQGGIPVNYYLKIASGAAPVGSNWFYGSYFEDPDNNFTTSIELQSYLTVNIDGNGSVDSLEPSYNYGTSVPITAVPDQHMDFIEWTGSGIADPSSQQTTVDMTADRNITAVFAPHIYNVTINQTGKGTITPSGTHAYGSILAISATPATGYDFSHWDGYGPDSNTSQSTNLTIQQDHAIVAVFTPLAYNLETTATVGGSTGINESSPYLFDSNYTLFASPEFGYDFSHWDSPSGSLSLLGSQSNSISSVFVQGDASYHANFSLITYNLSVSMDTGGMAVSPASGNFSALSLFSVSATPLTGYNFAGWIDPNGILANPNLAITDANMSAAMSDASITATFSKKTYPVTISEGDGGNISLSPATGPWEHYGVYEVNATAQNGYSFSEWQGDLNSTSSLLFGANEAINKIGVSGPVSLNAVFIEDTYVVSTTTNGEGTVSASSTYSINDTPSVEAVPENGWYFDRWEGDLQYLVAPESSASLINLTTAPLSLSYTAVFSREIYDITVNIEGNGTVNDEGEAFTLSPDSATTISLHAVAGNGWYFDRWYGQELPTPTDASITYQPTESVVISSSFLRNSYYLTVSSSLGGEANGTGSYLFESNVHIQATPSPGFMFSGWTGNTASLDSSSPSLRVQMADQNLSLEASFSPIPLTVTTAVSGSGGVSGAGIYDMGETAILQALPGEIDAGAPRGHQLDKWIWHDADGNYFNSTDNPLSLPMDSNFSVTAFFTAIPPDMVELTLISSPEEAGILFDDPTLRVWNTATDLIQRELLASTNPGFSFVGWSSEEDITYNPSWKNSAVTINAENNASITANFQPKTVKVEFSYDSTRGTVTGGGQNLPTNTLTPITALPSENRVFYSWEIDKNINYTVTQNSSSITESEMVLFIDGKERPELSLIRGYTYSFVCDLPDNEKIYISESSDASESDSYNSGITDSQVTDGLLSFSVPTNAPDSLYYHGTGSAQAGNKISVHNVEDSTILPFPNEPSINPVLSHDLALNAVFVGKDIAVTIIESTGGAVTGIADSQTFAFGESTEITAIADEHFEFVRWELSNPVTDHTTDTTISFEIYDTLEVRPIFKAKMYSLNLLSSPTEGGNAFTTNNQYLFPHGTNVTIQVIPLPGNRFENWSGKVVSPTKTSTSVLIEKDTTIIAQFSGTLLEITKATVTLDDNGSLILDESAGTITGGNEFALGATSRFSVFPKDGFEFIRWEDETGTVLSTSSSSNIQISGFSKLYAVLQKKSYEVQIASNPTGKGEVAWEGLGAGESLTNLVAHGTSISLTATPVSGYVFDKWTSSSGDLYQPGNTNLEITISKTIIINARFSPVNPVELVIGKSPANSGWTFGQGTVNQNPNHSIFAKPNPGYLFDRWDGSEISNLTSANTQINLNQDKEISAYFKVDPSYDPSEFPTIDEVGLHNLRVKTADYSQGSVSGSGIFGTGWAEIKASAQDGYAFVRWDGSDVEDKTSKTTFLFLREDSIVEAIFQSIPESNIEGSVQLATNWWNSDWFGTYWQVNDEWSFNTKLGWIHIQKQNDSSDSIWVWIDRIQAWCWTGPEIYPYLYNQSQSTWNWVDIERSTGNRVIFFKFDNNLVDGVWVSQ